MGAELSRQQEEERQREAVRIRLRQQEMEREERRQELAAQQRSKAEAAQPPSGVGAGKRLSSPMLEPLASAPPRLEGELQRKTEFEGGGKRSLLRSWKQVHVIATDGSIRMSHSRSQVCH